MKVIVTPDLKNKITSFVMSLNLQNKMCLLKTHYVVDYLSISLKFVSKTIMLGRVIFDILVNRVILNEFIL